MSIEDTGLLPSPMNQALSSGKRPGTEAWLFIPSPIRIQVRLETDPCARATQAQNLFLILYGPRDPRCNSCPVEPMVARDSLRLAANSHLLEDGSFPFSKEGWGSMAYSPWNLKISKVSDLPAEKWLPWFAGQMASQPLHLLEGNHQGSADRWNSIRDLQWPSGHRTLTLQVVDVIHSNLRGSFELDVDSLMFLHGNAPGRKER